MKILSFKVQPNTASTEYATEGKVYFQGDKWTERRSEASQFSSLGAMLQAFSEFSLLKGRDDPMPLNNLADYAFEDAEPISGTVNHLELTDDEVKVLEFAISSLGYESQFHPLLSGLVDKLRSFGLSDTRRVYHVTLGGTEAHFVNREPWEAGIGGGLLLVPGSLS